MLLERKHDPQRALILTAFRKRGDRELSLRRCVELLELLNMKAPRRLIKKKFLEMNLDGSSGLNLDEFLELVRSFRARPEIGE